MRRLYLAIIRMMLLEGYACAMIDKMLNMSKRKRQEDGEAMQPEAIRGEPPAGSTCK